MDRKSFYEKVIFEQRLKGNEGVSLGAFYVKDFLVEKKTITKATRSNPSVSEEEPGG